MPAERGRILLVEDDPTTAGTMAQRLRIEGYGVEVATGAIDAAASLERRVPDLLLSDLHLPDGSGEELFLSQRSRLAGTPVLVMTAYAGVDQAIRLMKAGADDFLVKPVEIQDLLGRVGALMARRVVPAADATLGVSAAIRRVEATVRRAAPSDCAVLLLGETGTGKEVAARLLHGLSPRAAAPFVAVNCAAVPADLAESEFFGHERGAFTGAATRRHGYAERAGAGTLFLDEVAELAPVLQAKLLRLLEAGEYTRVGGSGTLPFHARVVAATNADLDQRVREGRFREDLLYRLDVIRVEIPPLRMRREDIVPLARQFLARASLAAARGIRGFDSRAERAMEDAEWRGNARELRNRVERAAALSDGPWVGVDDVFGGAASTGTCPMAEASTLAEAVMEAERRAVTLALAKASGEVEIAASILGVGRSTLFEKIRKLGLRRPETT
ncbi:sigma-54-dependent transcriptional regulator [Pseudoroseomonas cervicalis]|uniref:Sigma-54 interaction domain protein n=1 Tax=Pseudoroseomonas cervicalis ATCC 49957 TaxID=525371 RepID=D5RQU0_9PROT|nr:sigma-54 dependent transcriptional regulator [Pseudoroseomonas cervicalis]EFH10340.1 Sigma-54 interaction domain protein [Pseudoroseomonas cervicalis ATCC 49957]